MWYEGITQLVGAAPATPASRWMTRGTHAAGEVTTAAPAFVEPVGVVRVAREADGLKVFMSVEHPVKLRAAIQHDGARHFFRGARATFAARQLQPVVRPPAPSTSSVGGGIRQLTGKAIAS